MWLLIEALLSPSAAGRRDPQSTLFARPPEACDCITGKFVLILDAGARSLARPEKRRPLTDPGI